MANYDDLKSSGFTNSYANSLNQLSSSTKTEGLLKLHPPLPTKLSDSTSSGDNVDYYTCESSLSTDDSSPDEYSSDGYLSNEYLSDESSTDATFFSALDHSETSSGTGTLTSINYSDILENSDFLEDWEYDDSDADFDDDDHDDDEASQAYIAGLRNYFDRKILGHQETSIENFPETIDPNTPPEKKTVKKLSASQSVGAVVAGAAAGATLVGGAGATVGGLAGGAAGAAAFGGGAAVGAPVGGAGGGIGGGITGAAAGAITVGIFCAAVRQYQNNKQKRIDKSWYKQEYLSSQTLDTFIFELSNEPQFIALIDSLLQDEEHSAKQLDKLTKYCYVFAKKKVKEAAASHECVDTFELDTDELLSFLEMKFADRVNLDTASQASVSSTSKNNRHYLFFAGLDESSTDEDVVRKFAVSNDDSDFDFTFG